MLLKISTLHIQVCINEEITRVWHLMSSGNMCGYFNVKLFNLHIFVILAGNDMCLFLGEQWWWCWWWWSRNDGIVKEEATTIHDWHCTETSSYRTCVSIHIKFIASSKHKAVWWREGWRNSHYSVELLYIWYYHNCLVHLLLL